MDESGEFVSELDEQPDPEPPEFDPLLIQTVDGTCTIKSREGAPDEVRTFTVDDRRNTAPIEPEISIICQTWDDTPSASAPLRSVLLSSF